MSVTKQLHTCERCGAGFYPKRTDRLRFCGRACGLAFNGDQAKARAAATAAYRDRAKAEAKAQRQAEAARRKVDKLRADALAKGEHYKPRPCQQCGETFQPARGRLSRCKPCVDDSKAATRRADVALQRAKARGYPSAHYVTFDPYEIFERDGWTCQECGTPTPKSKRGLNAWDSPELDHVKALSYGGWHTPGNTQCLCRACNVAKSIKESAGELV